MGKDKPNISQHTNGILSIFGLHPPDVADMHITPNKITFTVFLRNEAGNKFVVYEDASERLPGDAEGDVTGFSVVGVPATQTVSHDIRT